MPVSSDGVAIGLITAVQTDTGVWVRRAVSAVARSRCHLVCHWLRDLLPSKYRLVGHTEPRSRRDHSATTGGPGAGTGVGAAPADAGQSSCPSCRQSGLVRGSLPSSPRGQHVEWLAGCQRCSRTSPGAEGLALCRQLSDQVRQDAAAKLHRLTQPDADSKFTTAFHVTCFTHTGAGDHPACRAEVRGHGPDSDAGYPQYGGHMATVLDLSYWIR